MRKLLPIGKGVKARRERVKEILGEDFKSKDLGVRVELIRQLIPLGLMQIVEMLQEEVRELAGDWYKRDGKTFQGGQGRATYSSLAGTSAQGPPGSRRLTASCRSG